MNITDKGGRLFQAEGTAFWKDMLHKERLPGNMKGLSEAGIEKRAGKNPKRSLER